MTKDLRELLEDDIATLKAEIRELKEQVTELKVKVAELSTEIKALKQNNTTVMILIKYVVTPLILVLAGLAGVNLVQPP